MASLVCALSFNELIDDGQCIGQSFARTRRGSDPNVSAGQCNWNEFALNRRWRGVAFGFERAEQLGR